MDQKRKRHTHARSFPGVVALGVGISLATGMALLFLCACILWRTQDPTAYILPLGLICLLASALLCGWLCTVLWGHPSLLPALAGAALLTLLISGLGLCVPGTTLSWGIRCAGVPLVALTTLVGGALGGHKKRRRRRFS